MGHRHYTSEKMSYRPIADCTQKGKHERMQDSGRHPNCVQLRVVLVICSHCCASLRENRPSSTVAPNKPSDLKCETMAAPQPAPRTKVIQMRPSSPRLGLRLVVAGVNSSPTAAFVPADSRLVITPVMYVVWTPMPPALVN